MYHGRIVERAPTARVFEHASPSVLSGSSCGEPRSPDGHLAPTLDGEPPDPFTEITGLRICGHGARSPSIDVALRRPALRVLRRWLPRSPAISPESGGAAAPSRELLIVSPSRTTASHSTSLGDGLGVCIEKSFVVQLHELQSAQQEHDLINNGNGRVTKDGSADFPKPRTRGTGSSSDSSEVITSANATSDSSSTSSRASRSLAAAARCGWCSEQVLKKNPRPQETLAKPKGA